MVEIGVIVYLMMVGKCMLDLEVVQMADLEVLIEVQVL